MSPIIIDVGSPYEVKDWRLEITVECKHCNAHNQLVLTNGPHTHDGAECPTCGTKFDCAGLRFEINRGPAKFLIGYEISEKQQVM